ncbi:MAG: hypothetical protein J6A61_09320 [Clostridia bacterium]|nr:hypothetical protein [Clostridia bacterium]
MKKLIAVFVLTVYVTLAFGMPVSAAVNFSITMAINEEVVLTDGIPSQITPPILVADKTYVDLYAVAPLIGMDVCWMAEDNGYFQVRGNGLIVDFTRISQWDELIRIPYKFFVKDSKIFVSLAELAELAGYPVSYTNGLIVLGAPNHYYHEAYVEVDTSPCNDYVYANYPVWAEYVVNPYQEYSYETMQNDIARLQTMYPDLIKTSSIGQSVEGRELTLIEFGRGPHRIFVCGTHHAREYISTTYLLYAIDRYAYAYRTNSMWGKYSPKEILDYVTFCVVPMVNPDGVNLVQNGIGATQFPDELANMKLYEGAKYGYSAWKANIRGVDLNWNYDKDWLLSRNRNPRGSVGFNGDHPYSEPETIAVTDYVDSHPFDAYLSFHTQGKLFYWGEDHENPTYINQLLKKDTGFSEITDPGAGPGGSFFDYVYRNYHKPTITVELCPYVGNFPYPNSDFDTVWKPAKNILLLVANEILYQKFTH